MCSANIEFHQHQGLVSPGKWGHALQSSSGSFYFPIFLTQTPALNPGTACGEVLGGHFGDLSSASKDGFDASHSRFSNTLELLRWRQQGLPHSKFTHNPNWGANNTRWRIFCKKNSGTAWSFPSCGALFKIPIIWFKSTSFVGSWLLLHWDSLIQSCVLFSGGMPHVFIFQSLISANSSISARSKVVLLFRSAIFFPKWTKWKVDVQRYLKIIIKYIYK